MAAAVFAYAKASDRVFSPIIFIAFWIALK